MSRTRRTSVTVPQPEMTPEQPEPEQAPEPVPEPTPEQAPEAPEPPEPEQAPEAPEPPEPEQAPEPVPEPLPPTAERPLVEGDPDAGKTPQAPSVQFSVTSTATSEEEGWNAGQRAPFALYEVYDGKGWGPDHLVLTDAMEPGSRGSVYIAAGDVVRPEQADRIAALATDAT